MALTLSAFPQKLKIKIYNTNVESVLLYGYEDLEGNTT